MTTASADGGEGIQIRRHFGPRPLLGAEGRGEKSHEQNLRAADCEGVHLRAGQAAHRRRQIPAGRRPGQAGRGGARMVHACELDDGHHTDNDVFGWPKAKYDPQNPDDDRMEVFTGQRKDGHRGPADEPAGYCFDAADRPERADPGENTAAVGRMSGRQRAPLLWSAITDGQGCPTLSGTPVAARERAIEACLLLIVERGVELGERGRNVSTACSIASIRCSIAASRPVGVRGNSVGQPDRSVLAASAVAA